MKKVRRCGGSLPVAGKRLKAEFPNHAKRKSRTAPRTFCKDMQISLCNNALSHPQP